MFTTKPTDTEKQVTEQRERLAPATWDRANLADRIELLREALALVLDLVAKGKA